MMKILKVLPFNNLIKVLYDMSYDELTEIIRQSAMTADWPTSRIKIAVWIISGRPQNSIYNALHQRYLDEPVARWSKDTGVKMVVSAYTYGKNAFKMYERDFKRFYRTSIRINNANKSEQLKA